METKPTIVFFGTPEFATPALEKLIRCSTCELLAVVTQPDRPAGRGNKLQSSPVKKLAEANQLPVFQPESLKKISLNKGLLQTSQANAQPLVNFLNQHAPIDAFIVIAYGEIIRPSLIEFPRCGILNIHASLLPRWRGAAPIHRAIEAGDRETGVCLMQIEAGLDTGPVFSSESIEIADDDNFGALHDRLAKLGATLLLRDLPKILNGELRSAPQPKEGISYAEKWEREDCEIRWSESAAKTQRRVRACAPALGARTKFNGELLKVFTVSQKENRSYPATAPGEIVEVNRAELIVACGNDQFLSLDEIQIPGKRRMPIAEALKGHAFAVGEKLG